MVVEGETRAFQLAEAAAQLAAQPFMALVKMGAGFELGYVIRDNFTDTPHFETKLHPSGETYQGSKDYHLKCNYCQH